MIEEVVFEWSVYRVTRLFRAKRIASVPSLSLYTTPRLHTLT